MLTERMTEHTFPDFDNFLARHVYASCQNQNASFNFTIKFIDDDQTKFSIACHTQSLRADEDCPGPMST
jgi:hypothetical protein